MPSHLFSSLSQPAREGGDETATAFFDHTAGARVNTHAVISRALQRQNPNLELVTTPVNSCDLFNYANHASTTDCTMSQEAEAPGDPIQLLLSQYMPSRNRTQEGRVGSNILFGRFRYTWQGNDFLVYLVDGRDGTGPFPTLSNYYILTPDRSLALEMILKIGQWTNELHDEVWVFDLGYWQKSAELYDSIRKASWDNVILDAGMKKMLIEDHTSFFASKERYTKLNVPWKRGIIYYGPPGNGKTISIKAMMHLLYNLKDPIPTLYVRSLSSIGGPEYAVKVIFDKARSMAPCYLVFEDLDSLITDRIRSYFLNEVDGLKSNDGIFMVGSTNHLDQLDPGISKRPSRFDRKYLFSNPIEKERIAYCHFWQGKLKDNKDIEFPDKLCGAIAGITKDFSFAYMQEAFVAALLAIARQEDDVAGMEDWREAGVEDGDWTCIVGPKKTVKDDADLERLILWREMKKQIAILREGIESGDTMVKATS